MRDENLKSGHDLVMFLKLHGINEDEKIAEQIWESMPEPVAVVRRKRVFLRDNYRIIQIMHIWEKNNVRYALLNDKRIRISKSIQGIYNYMDKGNYFLGDIVLMFPEISEEIVQKLRKYLARMHKYSAVGDAVYMEYDCGKEDKPQIITLDQLNRAIDVINTGGDAAITPDPESMKLLIGRLADDNNHNLQIDESFIHTRGMQFGVEDNKLHEFVFFPDYLDLKRDTAEEEVLHYFFRSVERLYGDHNLWLGNFAIKCKIEIKNKHTKRFLEGIELERDSFRHALSVAHKYANKKDYIEFLEKERETPARIAKLLQNGLLVRTTWIGNILPVRIGIAKEKGRYQIYSPVSGKKFPIKLSELDRLISSTALGGGILSGGIFACFLNLRKHLPEEDLLEIFERAKMEMKEAEERAEKLLAGVLQKHSDRIKETEFRRGSSSRRGFVIKGNKRNYFIDSGKLGIYTYPEGRYVCVVDKPDDFTPKGDRLAGRILMLMNDEDLKEKISTLNDRAFEEEFDDEYEEEEEFV